MLFDQVVAPVAERYPALNRFLAEHTFRNSNARVRSSILYGVFAEWAVVAGEAPMSQKAFSRALANCGWQSIKSDGMWWVGIGLIGKVDR